MKRPKLLVVDDEFLNRDMLKERLQRSGFEVAEAEDAQQALGVIERGGIDLVLLDMMMPGMTGIELLKLLRGVHGPSELPVIMATAVTDSDSVAEAFQLGANDYISKPIDFQVTLARIHSQLNRRATEAALRESEERLALAMRGTDDAIWDWDLRTNKVYYSPRWRAMAGNGESEIGDSPEEWLCRVHPSEAKQLRLELEAHWSGGEAIRGPFVCEYRLLHQDGSYHWMRSRAHTVRDNQGRVIRMTGTQTDITEHKVFDPLTGLPNRLLFLDRAGQALDLLRDHHGMHFAVLFLDVDRFKLINDAMGHITGDCLLVELAGRLKRAVQAEEGRVMDGPTVARFGGDEFAVLLNRLAGPQEAEAVAQSLLRALDQPAEIAGKEMYCTVSIGIANGNPSYACVGDLLRDADTAMYAAKARGGARYAVFDETMRQRAAARLEVEIGLRRALERKELRVYYQPNVNLQTNQLVGFEALVRWNHPALGLVPPAEFIPIAEETGQILAIGEWVTRESCRQLAAWHKQFPCDPALKVSVNLSVRQFRQPDLVDAIARIIEETGLAPQHLELEITETVVMEDPETAIATIGRLKDLGVGIKLDDFGSGYSSLSYLCRMPIDALKIDSSFIGRMRQTLSDLEVVRTVLVLAQSLQIEVVAEGVERDDQITQLRTMGCLYGQGYYFGKPMSMEDTEVLLARWNELPMPG